MNDLISEERNENLRKMNSLWEGSIKLRNENTELRETVKSARDRRRSISMHFQAEENTQMAKTLGNTLII